MPGLEPDADGAGSVWQSEAECHSCMVSADGRDKTDGIVDIRDETDHRRITGAPSKIALARERFDLSNPDTPVGWPATTRTNLEDSTPVKMGHGPERLAPMFGIVPLNRSRS